MKLRALSILTLIILIAAPQMTVAQPDTLWTRTFGGINDEWGESVQETVDGGFIIVGHTNSFGNGSQDVWLIKTDSTGNEEWNQTYGGSSGDYGHSVQQTDDGGYIVLGKTYSFGNGNDDVWLIKTDSQGNEQWNQTFGGSSYDLGFAVQQTTDGGYIIAGYTQSYGNGGADVWLIKTNSDGNEEWNQTFGGSEDEEAYSVQQTSDGGYILLGRTRSYGNGFADVWLIKTNSNGNEEWSQTFGGSDWDSGFSVDQTTDNGFIIAGVTSSYGNGENDAWLIKTDSNGDSLWSKTFGGSFWEAAFSVTETYDGGYAIAAAMDQTEGSDHDAWIIKTDSEGNEQWNEIYEGSDGDQFSSIQQTTDGGFIVTGYTQSYGNGGLDIWLIRLEGTGGPPYSGPTWHISNTGSDSNDGSEDNPFASIQHGIDVASDGDTVSVAAGTYVENIIWPATNGIKLIGSGEDDCIIDGDSLASVIRFEEDLGGIIDTTTIINGFTIQNGYAHVLNDSAHGGGIYLRSSSPTLINVTMENNSAFYGGGIYLRSSSPTLTNVSISSNSAFAGTGGGFYCYNNSSPILENVTITNNSASDGGGGIYCHSSSPILVNCILWNDSPEEIYISGGSITVSYSDIQGGWEGEGNIDEYPLFVDSDNDDYQLQAASPCIDAGDPESPLDPDSTRADMGAYYFDQTDVNIVNVTPDSLDFSTDLDTLSMTIGYVGLGDLSWNITDAPDWLTFDPSESGRGENYQDVGPPQKRSIKSLRKPSSSSKSSSSRSTTDTVQVIVDRSLLDVGITEDQFTVSTNYGDDIVFVSVEELYEGPVWYISTEGSDSNYGTEESPFATIQYGIDVASDGDTVLVQTGTYVENINFNGKSISLIGFDRETTIIDGGQNGRVIEGIDDNVYIKSVTIANGYVEYQDGGALSLSGYSENIMFEDCIFQDNEATGAHGNAIRISSGSSPEFINCLFIGNTESAGGTIDFRNTSDAHPIFNNCQFIGPEITANNHIHFHDSETGSTFEFNNCYFDNTEFALQFNQGNGIDAENLVYLNRCVFINNQNDIAISSSYVDIFINNSTFYSVQEHPGSYEIIEYTYTYISNSIFWGKSGINSYIQGFTNLIDYSITSESGIGNINADPLFVDPDNSYYTLQWGSPCIDTGDPASDLDPDGTIADMGAYYYDQTYGCTDPEANNYNPNSTIDDGSCIYSPQIFVTPNSLDFTINTDEGFEQSQTLTIENTGIGLLEVELTIGTDITTVQIGDQIWMAENLKVTHYRDGTAIPNITDNYEWSGLSTGAYCVYDSNESNAATYGYLYNWYAVDDSRNIAPEGWHVPTDEEIKQLEMYLGMSESEANSAGRRGTDQGSQLAGRADLWYSGNLENNAAFGTSGFTALPGGWRSSDFGDIGSMGNDAWFWSSTEGNSDDAWDRRLENNFSNVSRGLTNKQHGVSVRCVRDLPVNFWLACAPTTLTIQPDNSAEVTVTVNAEGLDLGDYSDIITITSNDPANSTIEVPVTMSVIFQDVTPPTVELLTPTTGNQLEIASIEELTWDATDNVGVTTVDLHYSIDGGSSWTAIVEGEDNTGLYSWTVPDSPSDQVVLSLIGHDAVGLSDTSDVTGLSITIVYPIVTEIAPQPGLLTWRDSQFTIAFSQAMSSIEDESIVISSGYSSSVIDGAVVGYVDELNTLTIDFTSGFASMDSVTITLQASGITNIYGYQLDGDGDGEGGDDYTINFTTAMLADYDTSGTIDGADLSYFIQGWQENDYFYELGPVMGDTPYLISLPDQNYNIDDIMAFILMWNWYLTNGSALFRELSDFGPQLQIEATQDTITVELPEGALAFDLQIRHDPNRIELYEPLGEATIRLQHYKEESDIYELVSTVEGENRLDIPVSVSGKTVQIEVSFRAFGLNGEILTQSTRRLTIENIPEQFALHQNYPNPFNPTTTIEYDLPKDAYVYLVIYDILGRELRTLVEQHQEPGYRSVIWDGTNDQGKHVGAGVYLYRVQAGEYAKTHKMVLLK